MKIETLFIIAALAFIAALAAIAYTTGSCRHEEPPSDSKRADVPAPLAGEPAKAPFTPGA